MRFFEAPWGLQKILLITIFFTTSKLLAQKTDFQHLTTSNGLPSNHIYCVFTDADGYLWVGTQSGAARYDGYQFQVFDQTNGLPDNEVLHISQDKQGRIWLRSLRNTAWIEEGRIHLPEDKHLGEVRNIRKVVQNGDSTYMFFLGKRNNHLGVLRDGSWEKVAINDTESLPNPCIRDIQVVNDQLWLAIEDQLHALYSPNEKLPYAPTASRPNPTVYHPDWGTLVIHGNQVLTINDSLTQRLTPLDQDGEPLNPILMCLVDTRQNVWLSSASDGLLCYRFSSGNLRPRPSKHCLQGETIVWATEDHEGNLWFGTLRNGLLMLPATSLLLTNLRQSDGLAGKSVESIAIGRDGRRYLSHDNNQVTCLIGQQIAWTKQISPNCGVCHIRQIVPLKGNDLAVLANEGLYALSETGEVNYLYKSSPKHLLRQGNHYLFSTFRGVQKIHTDSFPVEFSIQEIGETIYPQRAYVTATDPKTGHIWIGTNHGLFLANSVTGEIQPPSHPKLNVRITDIKPDKAGRIWVATDGNGLVVLNGERSMQITTQEGLNSNICRKILHDRHGKVWIGTLHGINYIDLKNDAVPFHIQSIRTSEGLPANEIHDLTAQGDALLVASSEGLTILPLDFFQRTKPFTPQVHVTELEIAGKDTHLLPHYELAYQQNELRIRFSARAFRARGDLIYRYRMQGLKDHHWTTSANRELWFRSLPPGNYKFAVQSKIPGGKWSPSAGFSLSIAPHFSQTSSFWVLCICLLLLLTGSGVRWRLHTIRRQEQKRNAQEKQVLELKLQALRSQMNPHFIFNSLSSIQQFISSHEERAAHKYLATFSRLIRRVLENSRTSTITLAEELETLKLYLSLEHLRFRDRLSFDIHLDTSLPPKDLLVPAMMVQPFVENAIQHGIRHKAEMGQLKIHFQQTPTALICTVEDNGIGRAAAKAIRRATAPPSRGLNIVEKRVQLLCETENARAEVQIEDLFDPAGKPAGTRVIIHFPLQTIASQNAQSHHH